MILYFSGTGNSEHVALKIAEHIGDEVLNLFDRIRGKDYGEICSDRPFVIVYPTYGWRMPRILQDYLEKTPLKGASEIYFVSTCGDSIGNMEKYLEGLCGKKQLKNMGCAQVVMPENYIAMFEVPDEKRAALIVKKADKLVKSVADKIVQGSRISKTKITLVDRLCSSVVNPVFYGMFVSAKKFYSTEKCISCGKCEQVCPLNNVVLEEGRPKWGKECTHCMACICKCPAQAIEYGSKSQGKPRYQCPG